MTRQFTALFLLLFYASLCFSDSSQWSDSFKEGWEKSKQYGQDSWDKSKEYGQYSWDETKKIWLSTENLLRGVKSEEERKQLRSDEEDERFREIWGTTFSKLEDGVTLLDDINKAPAYAFFRDDKKSLRKEFNNILDKT